jgi:hypothetical protein
LQQHPSIQESILEESKTGSQKSQPLEDSREEEEEDEDDNSDDEEDEDEDEENSE